MDFYVAKHLQPIKMLAHGSIQKFDNAYDAISMGFMGEVFQIKASIYPQLITDNI